MKSLKNLFLMTAFAAAILASGHARGQCMANFTYTVNGYTVNFTNTSSNGTYVMLWSFGDGVTSNLSNPSHTYANAGTYTVCLSVMNIYQQFCDSICQVITIQPSGNCTAAYTYTVNGSTVYFTNTSTNGTYVMMWDFGDGASSTQNNPTHTYASPGTYTVCLAIMDQNQQFCDSVCHTITIVPTNCTASFTYMINGHSVNFTNTSSNGSYVMSWNFGDGATSYLNNPSHTYALTGTYAVCLSVMDQNQQFCDSVCQIISIQDSSNCMAAFTYIANGLAVNFTNTSTNGTYVMNWSFGDGASSYVNNPAHTYSGSGTYTVCLSIMDQNQQFCDSVCQTITVQDSSNCTASFTYTVTGNTVSFTNTSTAGTYVMTWSFGDGTTGYYNNPSHIYANPGTYAVCLSIMNQNQQFCDSVCQFVTVLPWGISEMPGAGGIDIFPNPADRQFIIRRTGGNGDISLSLSDISGRTVRSVKISGGSSGSGYQMDLGDIPAGVYSVCVISGSGVSVMKLMVLHE